MVSRFPCKRHKDARYRGCAARFALVAASLWALAAPSLATEAEQHGLKIVHEGRPNAVVVLSDVGIQVDDAESRFAYPSLGQRRMIERASHYLVDHLAEMSGAELPIRRESDLGEIRINNNQLHCHDAPADFYTIIGDGELARRLGLSSDGLDPGGMVVQTNGNVLGLLGPADSMGGGGAIYAVIELLEMLDCRYLWPGNLGRIIPKRHTINIPSTSVRYQPPLQERKFRLRIPNSRDKHGAKAFGIELTDEQWDERYQNLVRRTAKPNKWQLSWFGWQRIGGDSGIKGGHAFADFWHAYGNEHPGWFALQANGSREQVGKQRTRLCVSNTELIAFVADRIIAEADADPNLKSVSLAPNDGGHDEFCMCVVNALGESGCKTLDPPDTPKLPHAYNNAEYSLTDRYVWFWNQIAEHVTKQHPDLLFVVDAYSAYHLPPVVRTLHPNLVVRFVSRFENWDAWAAKSSRIFWRPNMLYSGYQYAMLEFRHRNANRLKHAIANGAFALDVDSITHSWATRGMDYYVLTRLAWKPDLAINDIVDDFCRRGFGDGHEQMYRYFQRVAELTELRFEKSVGTTPEDYVIYPTSQLLSDIYTPQVVAELDGLLNQAAALTTDDENIQKRIAFLRVGLDFTAMQAKAYRMLVDWHLKGELEDPFAADALYQQRLKMLRTIFTDTPRAVNVACMNWKDDRYWRLFRYAVQTGKKLKSNEAP